MLACWHQKPDHRPTMKQVIEDLNNISVSEPSSSINSNITSEPVDFEKIKSLNGVYDTKASLVPAENPLNQQKHEELTEQIQASKTSINIDFTSSSDQSQASK